MRGLARPLVPCPLLTLLIEPAMTNTSLFPLRASHEEVVQEALAKLPITDTNVLIGILKIHQNTVINSYKEKLNESKIN